MTQNGQSQQHMTIVEYKEKIHSIVTKMMQIIIRSQRKIDDAAYRNTLKKIDKLK